jgi:hypothetical protein
MTGKTDQEGTGPLDRTLDEVGTWTLALAKDVHLPASMYRGPFYKAQNLHRCRGRHVAGKRSHGKGGAYANALNLRQAHSLLIRRQIGAARAGPGGDTR